MAIAAAIDQALIAEAARWGDYADDFYGVGQLYTPYDQLLDVRSDLLANWFPQRSQIVLDHFTARGLYPFMAAPGFEVNGTPQHGGLIAAGDLLGMAASSGTVYYTLDGNDPRLSGGTVNWSSAQEYDGTPVSLTESTLVRARALDSGQWSALNEAWFYLSTPVALHLAISGHGYLVLDQVQLGFGLDGRLGDDLWLIAADPATGRPLRFADHVRFDATETDVTLGRWPDGDPTAAGLFPMTEPTFAEANSGPVLGPAVISELHYHPAAVR
jgi:hypothetical protein